MSSEGVALEAIDGIQRHLEAIYCIELSERARDFLIDDHGLQSLVRAGSVAAELRDSQEQLLVQPHAEGLSVALYLSDSVRVELACSPSLQSHCHATEGVSHFLMLLWAAREERSVRLLDLELQAEVDKASTCLLLDRCHTGGLGAKRLLGRLFDQPRFIDHLSEPERERYRHAHRLAARYSRYLFRCLDDSVETLLAELRSFYRLSMEDKRCRARAA
ncbi:MAG: hypothetical protein CMP23_04960 [Rickettsiales bacterium]|nr:hypothetical protein [Rickettsiales bacterium]